ncbi:MAG: hypothetical protein JJT75_11915 [Opitutales bacterium]|nr:hypothetical protein [Opitutales bacterium]
MLAISIEPLGSDSFSREPKMYSYSMNRLFLLPLLAMSFLFGCQPAEELDYPFRSVNELAASQDHPPIGMAELYNERVIQRLKEAQEILVFRVSLSPHFDEETGETQNLLDAEAGPHLVEEPLHSELRSAVLDVDNFGEPYDCPFEPQLMIRFRYTPEAEGEGELTPESDQVDLLINFSCAEIMVFYRGIPANPRALGVSHDFFRILARIAETHFPTDPEFRGIADL